MSQLSRREFAALTAAAAVSPFACIEKLSAAVPITGQEVIDRIKKNIGVEWKPDSVDTIKAGDPSTIATAVVTTSMATLPVLRQAVKAGANVIISAQPTFYARADTPGPAPQRGGGSTATNAGSCSGTRSRKKPGCSRWRSGSKDLCPKCRCSSSERGSRSGGRSKWKSEK